MDHFTESSASEKRSWSLWGATSLALKLNQNVSKVAPRHKEEEHLKINQCENLWKCSLWQRSGFPSDCVSCWMWLQGAVWQGVVCRTNTQPQLICQDVQGFITFSQREDFNGAINDLVSRHNGNKQIDPTYDLLYHSEVSDFSDMKESLSMRMRGVPVWKCKPCQTCWAER